MVGVVKPSGHKVKLQKVVQDIKMVKPVNSSSDIDSLSIQNLGEYEGFGKYPCLANFISFMASNRLKPNSSLSICSSSSLFCRSLFVLFLLAIVLSVLLRYTDSDYLFGIFKFFLSPKKKPNKMYKQGVNSGAPEG
jgi:hypothetical protein